LWYAVKNRDIPRHKQAGVGVFFYQSMSILTHSDRISREPEGKVHITFICMTTLATIPHEAATERGGRQAGTTGKATERTPRLTETTGRLKKIPRGV